MDCISISYKNADISLRKKLAFSSETKKRILDDMRGSGYVSQCVLLCTCNRTEIYFCGKKDIVLKVLARYADTAEEILSKYILTFFGESAIYHLFKVSCGIDSMVVGEDEILGQTKEAYAFAKENNCVSHEFNIIFQAAFACAKKIKTQTALSKTSVSVATLAANEAARLSKNVNVLVIGATGKIGTTVLKNLISHKNVNVKATLRSHNSDFELFKSLTVETVDYNSRYKYIDEADCIISATSSPHYTVTFFDLKNNITADKHRLFIDLAVPPDIDSAIADVKGARLINIDYFEKLAKENNALKLGSVEAAKQIISEDIDELKKNLLFHDFLPSLDRIKNGLSDKPIEKILYKMKSDVNADEFKAFLKVLKSFE